MLTERTCGIVSVMRRRPVSRTSRVTIACLNGVTACRERNYRKRLRKQCYHAPRPLCKPVQAGKAVLDAAGTIKGWGARRPSRHMFNRHDLADMDLPELEQALESMGQ